jgi:hypothetical protein
VESDDEAEAERLKASLARMQQMMGTASASPAALMDAMQRQSSGGSQGALAATLLQRRSLDNDGQPVRPSREEIRQVLGMSVGLDAGPMGTATGRAFPKAPGSA